MKRKTQMEGEYTAFVTNLKTRIQTARISAARAVNRDLILLYWDIGRGILEKQTRHGWGAAVVETLSRDLQKAFPAMKGFSTANIWAMRRFSSEYSDKDFLQQLVEEIGNRPSKLQLANFLQQLVEEIPWGHHLLLMDKVKLAKARIYYLRASAKLGWSRNVLLNQIKAQAYERSLKAGKTHNFKTALPGYLAEQAEESLKSWYNLEFLGIRRQIKERKLEARLIDKVRNFILELGYGFCFVGSQHRLTLGHKEYFVDLLFYHRFLKSLVAIELKIGEFEPEFAGKMDFYLNLLNDKERGPGDNPSIGIILCAEKTDIEVEYALKTKNNPIGVAAYNLQSKLPANLKGKLPTVKQLTDVVRLSLPAGHR